MQNPWLNIPLEDYEAHMASAPIAQAQMLAAQFDLALKMYQPKSVAVLGCAGGNGLERIDPNTTQRVVAIDINENYIKTCHERFASRFAKLETLVADVQNPALNFEPVDLIYAGLIFEYTDTKVVIGNVRRLLNAKGVLISIMQLPSADEIHVSASVFQSLQILEPFMHLVAPKNLRQIAEQNDFVEMTSVEISLASGKKFQLQAFRII